MKNLIKLSLIAILLFALFLVFGKDLNKFFQNTDNTEIINTEKTNESITIKVIIPNQEERKYITQSIRDLNLKQIFERVMIMDTFSFKTEESSFGSFITTVNGIEADSSNQYWSIAINGEDAMQGISDINPANGDIITLTLKDL